MAHPRTLGPLLAAALMLSGCGFSTEALWTSPLPDPAKLAAAAPATPVAASGTSAATGAAPAPAKAAAATPPAEARKPFVVIRFETPDPDYAPALYDALSGALKRRPDAGFDLVAVTRDPDAAERHLADVTHALTTMGMPASRLSLAAVSAADDATDEVWIYLR